MRRLVSLAAFALVLTVPVWAQRGVGRAGGSHAGPGGGHAGGYSASHVGAGFSRGYGHLPNSGYSHNPYMHNGNHGHTHVHVYTYGFRNPCYGYGCRGWGYSYPWWGAAYYPWWWDEQDRQFDDDYYRQYEIANEMNRQSLEQQRILRAQEADQGVYAPRPPWRNESNSEAVSSQQGGSIVPATVLVFRDRHQEEVHNYAIVGETLWSFAPQHTQRIALDNLDLVATERANADRGVMFQLPETDEGQ